MPAVELTRLRAQIDRLAACFTNPPAFYKALIDLMELYADRTYRPGQATQPSTLLPAYHTPPLVLRQLEMRLKPLCEANPEAALQIADLLWVDSSLEPRQLATTVLGLTPATPNPAPVLARLTDWSSSAPSTALLDRVATHGAARLRQEAPNALLTLFESLLASGAPAAQNAGLKGLTALAQDRDFENLPAVFRLVSPYVQTAPVGLQAELLSVLRALANRTPAETAYFLRQMLSMAHTQAAIRLARRVIPDLPAAQQANLREAFFSRQE